MTIGYGYEPFRAGWWVLGFALLGSIVFSWGQRAGVIAQTDDKEDAALYQPFNGFIYSLETFLPLVDLQHAKHWLPDPNLHPKCAVDLFEPVSRYRPFKWLPNWQHEFGQNFAKHLRWYRWAHILFGWFFTTMFLAGVTGLVQKG